MPGSFPVASKILHKYEQDRAYRLHRQKVTTIKPKVATKGPKKYPHLILSLKKIQQEEEKQAEVDHENRLLLHKMTSIMKNRAQVDNWNEYEPRSLNFVAREKHIREIQSENLGIARRLEKAQPVINADRLEKDYQHKKYLQGLWNENAKDYEEVTPRHHKFKELKRSKDGIEGSDDYEDDFEDDDDRKSRKRDKLPPLSIKYSYNPYTNKTTSNSGSLPRLDGKQSSSSKKAKQPIAKKKATFPNKHKADPSFKSAKSTESFSSNEKAKFNSHRNLKEVIIVPLNTNTKSAKTIDTTENNDGLSLKKNGGFNDLENDEKRFVKSSRSPDLEQQSEDNLDEDRVDLSHKVHRQSSHETIPIDENEKNCSRPHSQKSHKSIGSRLNSSSVVSIENNANVPLDESHKHVDDFVDEHDGDVKRHKNVNDFVAESNGDVKSHQNVDDLIDESDGDVKSPKNVDDFVYETSGDVKSQTKVDDLVDATSRDEKSHKNVDDLVDATNGDVKSHKNMNDLVDATNGDVKSHRNVDDLVDETSGDVKSHTNVDDFVEETAVSMQPHHDTENDLDVGNSNGTNPHNVNSEVKKEEVTQSMTHDGEYVGRDSIEGNGDGICSESGTPNHSYTNKTYNKPDSQQTETTGDEIYTLNVAMPTSTGTPAHNIPPMHEQDDDEVSPTNPTDNDCKQLFKVAKELAPPAEIIIKTLVKKTPKQRMQTKDRFKEMYELDMVSELKSGLGSQWTPLIDAMMSDSTLSSAKKLHDALEEGDYSQTVEILCSCSKSSTADLKESYKKEYAVSLESDIKDKTDDPEQALLLILHKGLKEDSGKVDDKTAGKDAEQLNEMGEGRWSSSSGKFLKLLSTKSLAHLRVVLNLYTVETGGREATDDIKKECSKNYADAVVMLLQQVKGSETHYADKLFMNMTPTNPVFIDILVNKNEADMAGIRREYKKKYDAELADDVKHKCKGHPTEKIMVELAGKSKGKATQKKGSTSATVPPPAKKTTGRKPSEHRIQSESKKDNPLSKPTPRVAADAAQQKKEERKAAEKDKKQKEEEKKNKNGTVQEAAHFDPEEDILTLHDAMSGLGTDEALIIEIIPCRSNSQRQTLKKKYQEKYKKDLTNELKSELTGDFEEIVLALMMTPVEYDAYCLHEAMDGLGTTEATLIGIICTRNAKEKQAIKEQYKKAYKKDLEKDLIGDTSGGFSELLLELLKGERDQGSSVNHKQAQEDAKKLCNNGEQKAFNLDSPEFKEIMTKRNQAQVRATFEEYKKIAGHDIYQGIANAMAGDSEDAYIGLATVIEDPVGFYAERLSRAFSGIGTNDNMLIRIVVSRSELDLAEIKVKYKDLCGKTVSQSIESECSGDYKKMLLAIVGD